MLGSDPSSYDCGTLTATTSAFDENVAANTNVSPVQGGWFIDPSSDYRLTGQGGDVFGDIAQWLTGDPTTDIEGAARPAVDATADVAGADLP